MNFNQKQWFEVKNVLMDLFLTNSFPHKKLIDVQDCDVFISCLDSHSDGTHSLQSKSTSLVSKFCNATFLQICSDE